jgi:hypothetical protein
MNRLPAVEREKVAGIAGDEDKALTSDYWQEAMVRRPLQMAEHHMRGGVAPRMGKGDKVRREAFVDQEWIDQAGRPAFSHSRHASIPSRGSEG